MTCDKCINPVSGDHDTVFPDGEEVSEKITNGSIKPCLRVMSWNADGLSTQVLELKARLIENDVDICLVQETKLRPHLSIPSIPGYAEVRSDRKATSGGGLITYVKKSLISKKIQISSLNATESSTISVKMGTNK